MKSTFWKHSGDPYDIFRLLQENPRIPKSHFGREFKVNPSTGESWYNSAIDLRIIIPPVFRRKSYTNFREYFYFVKSDNPHQFFESIQEDKNVLYCSVQTGFADVQIISKSKMNLEEIVLSGPRSDYYVSIPPNCTYEESISRIEKKFKKIDKVRSESPLKFFKKSYGPWDDLDEAIFWSFSNNVRKKFKCVMEETSAYSDKIMKWYRGRHKFGDTIVMFFPESESYYQLTLYAIETEYDNVIIDLFSQLPTSSVFYRIDKFLIMAIYISFPFASRSLVQRILEFFKKEKLVFNYTNSIVEYGHRPV